MTSHRLLPSPCLILHAVIFLVVTMAPVANGNNNNNINNFFDNTDSKNNRNQYYVPAGSLKNRQGMTRGIKVKSSTRSLSSKPPLSSSSQHIRPPFADARGGTEPVRVASFRRKNQRTQSHHRPPTLKSGHIRGGSSSRGNQYSRSPQGDGQMPSDAGSRPFGRGSRRKSHRSRTPNIVVIMTDDQDVLLGSLRVMPKLQQLLVRQGTVFNNSFVPTPMCCPSRSTFLTGLYTHNHNVYTNNANCSSFRWQQEFESRSFATYINHTHLTGYFGKYLNKYNGSHIPAGWHRWQGLIRNSRYYNYTLINELGVRTRHGDNYYDDYLTDVVANDGCNFLQESKRRNPDKPVMMVLSVPAPHGPEDTAPQYQHMFENTTLHRTPAWNYAPNPDKQWLLQYTYKMIQQHKRFTDLLQRRRLQTLQSVDDLIEKVVKELDILGELDNTHIIFTSDHGYHLGQFGLVKGKGMNFDFDTRVPLIIRGPGVPQGVVISNIVSNVDMAPSIIDLAGGSIPKHMDGQSFVRLIKAARVRSAVDQKGFVSTKRPWRDTILIERGKLTEKVLKQRMRTEEQRMLNQMGNMKEVHYYIPARRRKLVEECAKEGNRLPCKPQQKWYCIETNGHIRKHKCGSHGSTNSASISTMQKDDPGTPPACICQNPTAKRLTKEQRRRQRRLMKGRLKRDFRGKIVRKKRSILDAGSNGAANERLTGFEAMFNRRCRILANQSVLCDLDIYRNAGELQSHKERIDDMIREYRKALEDLRDIRRHLKQQRPINDYDNDDDDFDYRPLEGSVRPNQNPDNCDCDDAGSNWMELGKRRNRKGFPLKRQTKKKKKKRNQNCSNVNMNCFTHNNDHWKTPPYWTDGRFCFCSNANNNTFWCLRTINQTHDFLYCEFITTFISYFDLHSDPYQMKNKVLELNYGVLQQLHEELKKLKQCKGAEDCTLRSSQRNRLPPDPDWDGLKHLRNSNASRYRDDYEVDTDFLGQDDLYDQRYGTGWDYDY